MVAPFGVVGTIIKQIGKTIQILIVKKNTAKEFIFFKKKIECVITEIQRRNLRVSTLFNVARKGGVWSIVDQARSINPLAMMLENRSQFDFNNKTKLDHIERISGYSASNLKAFNLGLRGYKCASPDAIRQECHCSKIGLKYFDFGWAIRRQHMKERV